ncbi:radical SAM family heme chaperone HemW [soil metagenome]
MPGIYLHIPFCKQACHYCDFHFSTSLQSKDDLLKALLKEVELQKKYFTDAGEKKPIVQTVYFGGGTPSLLSGEEIESILDTIRKNFIVDDDAEITLEANPDDLSPVQLNTMRNAGINRLSIGIQSFDDADLKWMNRVHTSARAIESVKQAQEKGFDNITIDLIYGTPLLSDEQWKKNLEIAFALDVQHLSCYALTVEPRTALAHLIAEKKQTGIDDAKQAAHFGILIDMASKSGFEQYEISNFARSMKYSRHNSSYWQGEKYLGLGPSAHSFNGDSRQWNIRNNAEYTREINAGKIPFERELLTPQNKFNEYIMTSLRTMWGCSLEKIRIDFGNDYAEIFFRQAMQKLTEGLLVQQRQYFTLSQKGKFFADKIASDFFVV